MNFPKSFSENKVCLLRLLKHTESSSTNNIIGGDSLVSGFGDLGFGGHCLPKDLSAIISLSGKLGGHTVVLEAVRNLNLWIRKHKDWEEMKGRAVV